MSITITRRASFNGPFTADQRDAWFPWLEHHGIDLNDLPVDTFITVDDAKQTITYLAYAKNMDGKWAISGNDILREERTTRLDTPIDPFPGDPHPRAV